MELAGIYHHNDSLEDIQADVVLVCTPTREIRHYANLLLAKGICTIDSFDIHTEIYSHMQALKPIAMQHEAVSIVSAGWDPGTDSLIRTIMLDEAFFHDPILIGIHTPGLLEVNRKAHLPQGSQISLDTFPVRLNVEISFQKLYNVVLIQGMFRIGMLAQDFKDRKTQFLLPGVFHVHHLLS